MQADSAADPSAAANAQSWDSSDGASSDFGLNAFLGPPLVATWINSVLFGLVIWLLAIYKRKFWKSDTWPMRALVIGVVSMDTLDWVTQMAWVYGLGIANWGNWDNLRLRHPEAGVGEVANGLASVCVQTYLNYRTYKLAQSKILFGITQLLISGTFASAVWCAYNYNATKYDAVNRSITNISSYVWMTTLAATDLLITCTLAWSLLRLKRETSFAATQNYITRILLRAVETASVSAFLAVLAMSFTVADAEVQVAIGCSFLFGKSYLLTLLLVLNMRQTAIPNHPGNGTSFASEHHSLTSRKFKTNSTPLEMEANVPDWQLEKKDSR